MKRLRLYFVGFSILVAVPFLVLISHTYNNLEQESFFFYRQTAEGLTSALHERLGQNLRQEEQRPYTHYRYIHVADRPIPQQEGLNLSPLAGFPVRSQIPGILGYYQIDPDGSFHTPLLPDGPENKGIEVPEREARGVLRDLLAGLLQGRTFHLTMTAQDDLDQPRFENGADNKEEVSSTLKKNLESNVDLRLEQEYYRKNSQDELVGSVASSSEQAEATPYLQRRVQKTSPKQALVFDSQLKDTYIQQEEKAKRSDASPGPGERQEAFREGRNRLLQESPASGLYSSMSDREVVAEVDPLSSQFIDGEWLVFYRKVWWHDRRYIQGFVVSFRQFLEAHLNPVFQNSPLPDSASYLLFHQGELVSAVGAAADGEKPLLLYSGALPHPLSDFQLAVTVDRLPGGPVHRVVNFLAVFLSLLLSGGLFGIYRLTATQIELSQKKSDFVSAVSHELKTPLTAIRMYGEMLTEGWVEEEKKAHYYRHIHDESERLSRLIQNVLTLAQLERKEWQVSLTSQDPAQFVTGVVETLGSQIERSGFEVKTLTKGSPEPIQADRDALTQILINLIDNAIKFSQQAERKEIVITVSQLGGDCYVAIRDFGPGIPRRKLKRIFEKFYRADNEMTRTTRGTGIGLALVKMLANAMGARLDVANRHPGAEFSLRFTTR